MNYQVIIFDWDGTLVDSEAHIVSSLQQAENELGYPPRTYDENKDIIGLGLREAFIKLYPDIDEQKIDLLKRSYSKFFLSDAVPHGIFFDGVLDVLGQLRSKGYKLAVATGKSRRGLDRVLEQKGMTEFFDIERCADETMSKPHPMMLEQILEFFGVTADKVLMVGDTEYDLEMAVLGGVHSIGVSYGVHDVARLEKHKPVRIIDRFCEILDLV